MLTKLFNEYQIHVSDKPDEPVALDMFDGMFVGQCSPIFRWVGGKTQLLGPLKFYAPKKFETYYEPFIGGGALLFSLMPKKAVINDNNKVLTNLYNDVKNNYSQLVSLLDRISQLPENESVFLQVRSIFNQYVRQEKYNPELSAMFMYLNAKAFNSLYRVNSKGEFNVGYRKELVIKYVYMPQTFQYAHDYFNNNDITIMTGDFLECTKTASKGDFVYFDPPYIPIDETKNFTSYGKTGFDYESQVALANEYKRLSDLGVKCMLSNSDSPLLYELYKDFNIRKLNVNYYIQPTSDDIKRQECLVLNY